MATDCSSQPIAFTPFGRRQLLAQFDGGTITSDAGALLLREVAGRSRLFERMAACIPDPRDPPPGRWATAGCGTCTTR